MLLIVVGEFVHPHGRDVWAGALVSALGALGVEEKTARQAMSRAAAEGLLTPSRHGRKVRLTLTDAGTALLRDGTERVYGFLRDVPAADGQWLVLSVAVPESQRRLRHRLRTRLTWLGLGSPTPGLWVSPDVSKAAAVRGVVLSLGLEEFAFTWTGSFAEVGDPARMLESAWDLDDVERRYLTFIDRFDGLRVGGPADAFVQQVQLLHEWSRFPFVDPGVPPDLLDRDWPGLRAAGTFHRQQNRWHGRAQAAWQAMDAAAGARN